MIPSVGCSLIACINQGQASPKPGTRNSLAIPCGWRGPNSLRHPLLPPRVNISRRLESQVDLGLKYSYSDMGCGHSKWNLNCLAKCPPLVIHLLPFFNKLWSTSTVHRITGSSIAVANTKSQFHSTSGGTVVGRTTEGYG